MSIRPVTTHDFYPVRRLPVQLARQSAFMMPPRKLRYLFNEPAVRLLVYDAVEISAFLAIRVIHAEGGGLRFLEIVHFATDRFAPGNGVAMKMGEKAFEMAVELGCSGVLALNEQLNPHAARFYKRAGFMELENTLMKKIDRCEMAVIN